MPDRAVAQSQSPLQALQAYSRGTEWSGGFDATLPAVSAVKSSQPTLSPAALGQMQLAIERYRTVAAGGGWPRVPPTRTALQLGVKDRVVETLRRRLMASGDLTRRGGQPGTFDSYVEAAVKRFQLRHGLTADGIVDQATLDALNVPVSARIRQLESNIGRIGNELDGLEERYVLVNIPAAEIEAVVDGRVRSRHTAVVGKTDRRTPILTSKIYEVNFNPYWTVPVSIIRKDLIPKMQEDPSYLEKNNIKIFRWGDTSREYDYREIDWYSDEATEFMFRQEPGEINSLGSVRINFHNKHQVYLHDTPAKNLFGDDVRFLSSGCVRVQNVRELITWLLQPNGWDRARVDQVIRSGERLDVDLERKTQLKLVYLTAWASADGVVHFRDDIYRKDEIAALANR